MKNYIILIISIFIINKGVGQDVFSSEDLQADAKLLWQALNELHPGLYRHSDTLSMMKAFEKILKDFEDDKSEIETFLHFSEFTSKIKCGHTYLNPFNQPNSIIKEIFKKQVLLPFGFSIIEGQMIVDVSFDKEIKENDIITHIENYPVEEVIDQLAKYVKADGNRQKKKLNDLELNLQDRYEYFDYYFSMIYGFENTLTISLNDGQEKVIQLVSKEERDAAFKSKFPNANSSNYDQSWSYKFHDHYAYLKLGSFVTWKLSFDWEAYLEEFFEELDTRELKNLIIDIRGNEGGMSDVSEFLVKKLAKYEGRAVYRKPHLAYKKVSENLKPHVSTWSKWFYNNVLWTKKLSDKHRTIKFSPNKGKLIKKNKNSFSGQSYLMVDEANSSATFILAELCKSNSYATLVGVETGGTKKGITGGQMFFLTLPNTKIEVDIPLIGFYPMSELPDAGIMPDIVMEQSLKAHINNEDQQLLELIEIIKRNI